MVHILPRAPVDYVLFTFWCFTVAVAGGLVGLILGTLRVPALLKFVGERPSRAAGTNLAVGFWVGVFGAPRSPAL
jgi:uncharacterized membrane protein YfcA